MNTPNNISAGWIEFTATREQLLNIMVTVVNESTPIGLGWMHYNPSTTYTPKKLEGYLTRDGFEMDYVDGRMVKFFAREAGKNTYTTRNDLRIDYQSWMGKYKTVTELLDSLGIDYVVGDGE